MGACNFSTSGSDQGTALGYLLGDITEEVTGVLKLSYYNGAKCESGKNHVVNIFFQCDKVSGVVSRASLYSYTCVHAQCTCTCTICII